jgi:hypothetical protein
MFIDESGIAITSLGMEDPAWGPTMVPLHPGTLEKIAHEIHTPLRLIDFMQNIRPRDDGRYILLHAIGAGEYWGSNKNGDYFPEWSLKGDSIPPDVMKYIRERSLPVPAEYGYRTFETYGFPFRHHNNSDRIYSIGERVCCAAYNDRMHRIELIIFIFKHKAPDLVEKIDKGIPIAWSMGSKLPFDVCSVCFNPARTRKQYCKHLSSMLNKVLPGGVKVFSYNYFPRFFDISEVTVPADRSAYDLKKVAEDLTSGAAVFEMDPNMEFLSVVPADHIPMSHDSRAEPLVTREELAKYAEMLEQLKTGEEKAADIDKKIPAQAPSKNLGSEPINKDLWNYIMEMVKRDREGVESMPPGICSELRQSPLDKVLPALTSLGIKMTRDEADNIIGDRELPSSLDTSSPVSKLLQSLSGMVSGRSMFEPGFSIRIIKIRKPEGDESLLPNILVKKSSAAYDRYVRWLRTIDLEKLSELTAHPPVQMLLSPSALKEKMLELEEEKVGSDLRDVFLPFIAGAALEE